MPVAARARLRFVAVFILAFAALAPAATPSAAFSVSPATVFINEFHYDNVGTDVGEAVELAGPAGTNLTGWSITLYNGNGGGQYGTRPLSGTIPNQQAGFGTLFVNITNIQNGEPDGLALVQGTTLIQFLSYDGPAFTAIDGPAAGVMSTDIGVFEPSDAPVGSSLQLVGTGTTYQQFSWSGPIPHTFGNPNTGQTFGTPPADQPVSVDCGPGIVTAQGTADSATVTATDPDDTVVDVSVTGVSPSPAPGTISRTALSPASSDGGTAQATITTDALVPAGTYSVSIAASNDDTDPQTANCTLSVGVTPPGQPVSVDCGPGIVTARGTADSATVTATDPDGTVVDISVTGLSPSPASGTISRTAFSPAPSDGGTAQATITADAGVPAGTYSVTITASNDDAPPQTASCTLSVRVVDVLPIGQVQGQTTDSEAGATDRSPYAPASGNGAGQTVAVQGVIYQRTLARTAAGGSNWGFFIQNTDATDDNDPLTSDGIFVFTGAPSFGGYTPQVGDEILLQGRVSEFFFLTQLGSATLLERIRSGVDVAAELPAFETAPPDLLAEANRYWERREGMRGRVPAGSLVQNGRNVFPSTADAEIWLIRGDHPVAQRTAPYERRVFRDAHPLDDQPGIVDNGNGFRILIGSLGVKATAADNTVLLPPAGTFDTMTTAAVGGLYFSFNKYQIQPVTQPAFSDGIDAAGNAPPQAYDRTAEYSSATYNVENLYDYRDDPFDGCDFVGNLGCPGVNPPFDYVPASDADYQARLDLIAQQIIGDLRAPELILAQEAEDQDICTIEAGALDCDGPAGAPVNNADGRPDTLQELALAISEAGGPTYQAASDRDGADDRGIVSAFLYRTDRVQLLPASADDPVLGSTPDVVYRGTPLAYNSHQQNPKVLNAVLPGDVDRSTGTDGNNVYTRAPQIGLFRVWRDGIGESVFTDLYAISNHFSSTPDARVGQRTEQAAYGAAIVKALLEADPALGADPGARITTGGDFNVYPRPDDPFVPPSDQLGPLYDAGLESLFDVLVEEVPQSAYSYVFVGQAQTLDQQFLSEALFAELIRYRVAHINADWAADYPGDGPRGLSDHDPGAARLSAMPTLDRMIDLVDYYAARGDITGKNTASRLLATLERAARFASEGKQAAYRDQLEAFIDQVADLPPRFISAVASATLRGEAELLIELTT
jgi:predicted extracellular nuclease